MRILLAVTVLAACGAKQPAGAPSNTGRPTPMGERPAEPGSPYKARTWIDKLGDPRESERAVTELEQLGDPSAIAPIGEQWVAQGKPVRMLQVMIALARPLTAEQAKATFLTDYEAKGRAASWDKALPFLTRALTEVDEMNPRSVDSATKAADALGEARQGLAALVGLASRPPTKKLIAAEIAAIRSLAAFEADKAKASAALLKIIARDAPTHPRTATDVTQRRALEENYGLYLATSGAAINALAQLRVPTAAPALVLSMYRTPELFTQVRRALVATGPTAKAELTNVLRGKSAAVDALFKRDKLDQYCGDLGTSTPCQPVSARDFYAAVVLGDFYDPATVPDLLDVLKRPAAPSYYADDQPSPSTQYNAALDSIRKIGAPEAAAPLRTLWRTKAADVTTRALAIGAFAFVSRDDTGIAELGAIAADNTADDDLRIEAATAFARLSRDAKDMVILQTLAQKYLDASAKKVKEAAPKKKVADAADAVFAAEKAKVEKAKADLLAIAGDDTKSATEIKVATLTAKVAETNFVLAKKKHKELVAPYKALDTAAKAYVGYARMFQAHIARIEIAIRCKADVPCYAKSLQQTGDDAARNVTPYISDVSSWTPDEKRELAIGAIDRAMLELGKQGPKAGGATEALLAAVASDERLVRQAILLALPKIAKLPCATCEASLDAAIRAGEGKTTLGDLNLETQILRNYYVWAGK